MILYVRCVNILSYRVNNKSGGCYKAFELENAARQVTHDVITPVTQNVNHLRLSEHKLMAIDKQK